MGQPQVTWPADRTSPERAPGPPVMLAAPAAITAVVVLDLALGGDVGLMFGLGFVAGCVWLGLLAPRTHLYVAALLPPGLMLALMLVLGVALPAGVQAPGAGPVQGVVAGFAHHSWALGLGYVLCLVLLGARLRFDRPRAD